MNSIEKNLKRWLKRRLKISLATIIAFTITGNVASALNLGGENNIEGNEIYENVSDETEKLDFDSTIINMEAGESLTIKDYLIKNNKGSTVEINGGTFNVNVENYNSPTYYNGSLLSNSGVINMNVDKLNITGTGKYNADSKTDSLEFKGITTDKGATTNINSKNGIDIRYTSENDIIEDYNDSIVGIENAGEMNISSSNGGLAVHINMSRKNDSVRHYDLLKNQGKMSINLEKSGILFDVMKSTNSTYMYFLENYSELNVNADYLSIRLNEKSFDDNSNAGTIYGIYNNTNSFSDFNLKNGLTISMDMEKKSGSLGGFEGFEAVGIYNHSGKIDIDSSFVDIDIQNDMLGQTTTIGDVYMANGILNYENLTLDTQSLTITLNHKSDVLDSNKIKSGAYSLNLIDNRKGTMEINSDIINLEGTVENINVTTTAENGASHKFGSIPELVGISNNKLDSKEKSDFSLSGKELNINLTNDTNVNYTSKYDGRTVGILNGLDGNMNLNLSGQVLISTIVKNSLDDFSRISSIGIENLGILDLTTNNLQITSKNLSEVVQEELTGIKNENEMKLDVSNNIVINIEQTGRGTVDNIISGISNSGNLIGNSKSLVINGKMSDKLQGTKGIYNSQDADLKFNVEELIEIEGFNNSLENSGKLELTSKAVSLKGKDIGILNTDTIKINSDTTIINSDKVAIKNDSGTTTINGKTTSITGDIETNAGVIDVSSDLLVLKGDILGEGTANISMKDNSTFEGKVLGENKNLNMTNSTWTMTGDSTINNMNLDNTRIDMSGEATRLDVNNLSGTNGTILMNVSKDNSDFFSIKGADTSSTHNIEVDKSSILNIINHDFSQNSFLIGEADNKVKFEGTQFKSLENLYDYEIILKDEEKQNDMNDWYVSGYKDEENEVVKSVEDDLSLYMMNSILARQELDSLHKRLGDIRGLKDEAGVWARYQTGDIEFNKSGVYAQNKYSNIEVGFDKVKNNYITGFAVNNRTGNADFRNGNGSNRSTGISLYRSYIGNNGNYFDVIGKGFFLTNDNTTTNEENQMMKADYDTYGGTLGIELGKAFTKKNWYLKPHLQGTYTYIKGADYETTTGVEVKQDDYNSLIGKAGLYAGYDFAKSNHFIKLDLLHEFDGKGKVKMTGADRSLSKSIDGEDTWFEIGIGGDFKVTDSMNIYYELDKNLDSNSFEHWQGTVGFRYRFNKLAELNPVVVLRDFTLKGDSYFDFDKSTLKEEGKAVIKVMSNEINNEERIGKLKIEGHTDSIGTEKYNQKLSERRAKTVEEEFKKNLNKEVEYEVKGHGETKPISDNTTKEGRAKNRRVEIKYIVEGKDER